MKVHSKEYNNKVLLLQGNEAIARGALEAGVAFCAGYPGNPSSEIIETLAEAAKELSIYVEWSVNEKVALEAATAASFAGVRSIVTMKQNGVNVASDFLTNLTLSGTKAGIVLVTCDDPSSISSTNEEDARWFARLADIPVLEPSTPQEALELIKQAFELSEKIRNVVILRSVSRLSHTRANVKVGELKEISHKPFFDPKVPFHTFPVVLKHFQRHEKLDEASQWAETCGHNKYIGPKAPELLICTSGCAFTYAAEAVDLLNLNSRVGILKISTTYPLPKGLVKGALKHSARILFLEDVDPFLEEQIKALAGEFSQEIGSKEFMGRTTGHIPVAGEILPSTVIQLLAGLFRIALPHEGYRDRLLKLISQKVPPREFGFCPGCPHRGTYYAIKKAIAWDDRDGFVSGDIGCYTMGIWPTGFNMVKSVHAMGSGIGLACGYGKLKELGFDQPVITVCGDSTFYHAALPGLVNSRFNNADILMIVLDNSATAMTGFQPHPGTGVTALGVPTTPVDIESLCKAMGMDVAVIDPYDIGSASEVIYKYLKRSGPRVLVSRRKCALVQNREGGFPYVMEVDKARCKGESCGCGRYCTRVFRCPGLVFDPQEGKAKIDEVVCVGCGICSLICPQGAIVRRER